MTANTETTLDAVLNGIVATIAANFPGLNVEDHRADRKTLKLPACLIDLEEFDAPDEDPGTGQTAMNARFSAQFIISFKQGTKNPKREIRKFIWDFIAFARLQRWGCPIGPATVTNAAPDDFAPELDQYEVWRVEWEQVINLGKSDFDDDGTTPSAVFLSQSPLVGEAYRDQYELVAGECVPPSEPEPEPEPEPVP